MRCTCGHDAEVHGLHGCSGFVWKNDRRRGLCRCRMLTTQASLPERSLAGVEAAGGPVSPPSVEEPPAPASPDKPKRSRRRAKAGESSRA